MFSFVGDVVLDPFGGTGSTAVAAAMLGRSSISVDVEERYVELMAARLAQSDLLLRYEVIQNESELIRIREELRRA